MRAGLIAKALGAQLLFAFCVGQAWAGPCVAPPVSDQAISEFKANPQAIVAPDAEHPHHRGFCQGSRRKRCSDGWGPRSLGGRDNAKVSDSNCCRSRTSGYSLFERRSTGRPAHPAGGSKLREWRIPEFLRGRCRRSFNRSDCGGGRSSATGSVGSVTITNPVGFVRPTTESRRRRRDAVRPDNRWPGRYHLDA